MLICPGNGVLLSLDSAILASDAGLTPTNLLHSEEKNSTMQ